MSRLRALPNNVLTLVVAALTCLGLAVIVANPGAAQPEAPVPQIVPKPAQMTVGSGQFTLRPDARIVASGHGALCQCAQIRSRGNGCSNQSRTSLGRRSR